MRASAAAARSLSWPMPATAIAPPVISGARSSRRAAWCPTPTISRPIRIWQSCRHSLPSAPANRRDRSNKEEVMRGTTSLLLAGAIAACALLPWTSAASAQTTLRIGLAEDPDILDPTLARTYVGRIVFSSLCDKLLDITPDLKVVPQLATEYKWGDDNKSLTLKLRQGVKFHDGEVMDAAAVKYSLERHLKLPGSTRKGEISAVTSID